MRNGHVPPPLLVLQPLQKSSVPTKIFNLYKDPEPFEKNFGFTAITMTIQVNILLSSSCLATQTLLHYRFTLHLMQVTSRSPEVSRFGLHLGKKKEFS